jgi:hypothetical protein
MSAPEPMSLDAVLAPRTAGRRAFIYRLRVLGRRGYGPTRERLSVCLCIGTLWVNNRICREGV